MNETFLIKENGFEEIKKQLIIKSLPVVVLALFFGLFIGYFNTNGADDFITTLPFTIPIVIFSFGFGIFKGLKRQRMIYETYKLVFSESNVIREQNNTPTINIPFTAIKSIVKKKDGSYIINGETAVEKILVPAQIDNSENLEVLFNKIKSVETVNTLTFEEKYRIPVLILTLGSMAVVYVSFNKILVGICGVIVSILLTRSTIQVIRNKSIDRKTKIAGYYSILVLASIIGVTIMKVFYM